MRALILWLFGLLSMGVLSYYCFLDRYQGIKEKLVSDTQHAFQAEGMDWVHPSIKGEGLEMSRVLSLEGVAPDETRKEKAAQIAKDVYGVSAVINHLRVDSKTSETPIKDIAKVSSITQEKEEPLQTLPVVEEKVEKKVPSIPSPYTFSATKEKSGEVILKGFVPNSRMHQEIIHKAVSLFGREMVNDQLKEAVGAPDTWDESLSLGLDKLDDVQYGTYTISDQKIHFQGFLPDAAQKESFIASFENTLGGDYTTSYDIDTPAPAVVKKVIKPKPIVKEKKAVPAQVCQQKLVHTMASGHINFSYNKAAIKATSLSHLDKVAKIIKSCNPLKIVIAGHTDSDGRASYNLQLSTKRAKSVKKYLVSQGIDAKRLITIGYGETKPIASNKNEDGKKQNRRITITVKGATK